MLKKTCWDCDSKQKQFCRSRSVSKNSAICELIQKHDFNAAKEKIA